MKEFIGLFIKFLGRHNSYDEFIKINNIQNNYQESIFNLLEQKNPIDFIDYLKPRKSLFTSNATYRVKIYYWLLLKESWDNDILRFEQLKFQQLKYSEMSEKIYKILQITLLKIYDMACSTWQPKIKEMSAKYGEFDIVNLPESVVKEMFDAATKEQLVTLKEIFPDFKKNKLKSWEELNAINGYYVDSSSSIVVSPNYKLTSMANKNIFATEKQAISSLAMSQLSQLMKDLGEECEVNWNDNSNKYCIKRFGKSIEVATNNELFQFLAFKTEKMADMFLEKHRELINQYWMID